MATCPTEDSDAQLLRIQSLSGGITTSDCTADEEEEERIDDWKLDFDFHVFAQHEPRKIYSDNLRTADDDASLPYSSRYIQVECVEDLTPLDMMNLGSGIHDATGNCAWMGGFLFLDGLHALQEYFAGKRVVELGSGTGVGGIGLLRSDCAVPSHVVLTDADPNALDLCRRNCQHNELLSYKVAKLTWGEALPPGLFEMENDSTPGYFDTVCATDVLYDIGFLSPLFQTAVDCLGRASGRRTFVLSHVPRACYSSEHPAVDNLESHIVERAKEFGFVLEKLLRPSDLSRQADDNDVKKPEDALNGSVTLEEMEQAGAAILVFSL
jgi:predicted nicotinamide N-methyase